MSDCQTEISTGNTLERFHVIGDAHQL